MTNNQNTKQIIFPIFPNLKKYECEIERNLIEYEEDKKSRRLQHYLCGFRNLCDKKAKARCSHLVHPTNKEIKVRLQWKNDNIDNKSRRIIND